MAWSCWRHDPRRHSPSEATLASLEPMEPVLHQRPGACRALQAMTGDALTSRAWLDALAAIGQRHRVELDGRAMIWRRWGSGPPAVLLHGGHGCWMHWARNVIALGARHTVWVPDLPGFGESDLPAQPSLEAVAQMTRQTLGVLLPESTPITLIGFSFGGLVAAQVAALRPAVPRLALLGPAGHGGPRRPKGDLLPWRPALKAQDHEALRKVMRHNLLMHMVHQASQVDELALAIHTDACAHTRLRSKPLSRAAGLSDLLASYSGRLLLVWGEHDVTADPMTVMERLNTRHAACTTHTLDGVGHWVQFEAAERCNGLLNDWLQAPTLPEN